MQRDRTIENRSGCGEFEYRERKMGKNNWRRTGVISALVCMIAVLLLLSLAGDFAQGLAKRKLSSPSSAEKKDYVLYLKHHKLYLMDLSTRISHQWSDADFTSTLCISCLQAVYGNGCSEKSPELLTDIYRFDEQDFKLYCRKGSEDFVVDLVSGKTAPVSRDGGSGEKTVYYYFNGGESAYYIQSDSLYRTDLKEEGVPVATGVQSIVQVYDSGAVYYSGNQREINLYDDAERDGINPARWNAMSADLFSFPVDTVDLYYFDGKQTSLVQRGAHVLGVAAEKPGIVYFSGFSFLSGAFDTVLAEEELREKEDAVIKRDVDRALLKSLRSRMFFHGVSGVKELFPIVENAFSDYDNIFSNVFRVMIDHDLEFLYYPANIRRTTSWGGVEPGDVVCDIIRYDLAADSCSIYAYDVEERTGQLHTGEIITYKNGSVLGSRDSDLYFNNTLIAEKTRSVPLLGGGNLPASSLQADPYYDENLGVHLFWSDIEGHILSFGTLNVYQNGKCIMQHEGLCLHDAVLKSDRGNCILFFGDVKSNQFRHGTMYRYTIGGETEVLDTEVNAIIGVFSR